MSIVALAEPVFSYLLRLMASSFAYLAAGSNVYLSISEDMTFSLIWIITVISAGICSSLGDMNILMSFSGAIFIFQMTNTLAFVVGVFFFPQEEVHLGEFLS